MSDSASPVLLRDSSNEDGTEPPSPAIVLKERKYPRAGMRTETNKGVVCWRQGRGGSITSYQTDVHGLSQPPLFPQHTPTPVAMGDRTCSVRVVLLVAALSALSLLVLTTMVLSVLLASGALVNGCSTCGVPAGERVARPGGTCPVEGVQ